MAQTLSCMSAPCVADIESNVGATREKLFAKAGMSLGDEENLVELVGHAGRHSNEYHQYVLEKLTNATGGLSGSAFREALVNALNQLKNELLANPEMVRGNFQ